VLGSRLLKFRFCEVLIVKNCEKILMRFCRIQIGVDSACPMQVVKKEQLIANLIVELFGCQATLNSNACTCDICVIKDGAVLPFPGQSRYTDLLYQADCTGVDGISKFNDCDGMLECYLLQRQHSVPWGNGPSVIPNYQR